MIDAGHTQESVVVAIQLIDSLALGSALVESSESPSFNLTLDSGRHLTVHTYRGDDGASSNPAFEFGISYLVQSLEAKLVTHATQRSTTT